MNKLIKIFVIHYEKLYNRKINISNHLNSLSLDYEFVTKYDRDTLIKSDISKFSSSLKNSYKANFLSHMECFKLISKHNHDSYFLILEDDSFPNLDFNIKIKKYLEKLPKSFDLFFISPGKNNFHIPLYMRRPRKLVYKKKNKLTTWGGHGASRNADAYFISKSCAEKLYNEVIKDNFFSNTTIDWWFNDMITKFDLKVYWAEPTITTTNYYESSF